MAQKVKFQIETPKGRIITVRTKNGELKARLQWNEGFGPKKSKDFSKAQEFVDSECHHKPYKSDLLLSADSVYWQFAQALHHPAIQWVSDSIPLQPKKSLLSH